MNKTCKDIKCANQTWHWDPREETWFAEMGKFKLATWKFGPAWQCFVRADVERSLYPKNITPFILIFGIRIGLESTSSKQGSMKKMVNWVKEYQKNGPQSWQDICDYGFKHFPDLYKTENDVIEHVFFSGGSGYNWFNGAIINEHPEDYKQKSNYVENLIKEFDTLILKTIGNLDVNNPGYNEIMKKVENCYKNRKSEKNDKEGILKVEEDIFQKVGSRKRIESYNIYAIPNNVNDEYLKLCNNIWQKLIHEDNELPKGEVKKYYNKFYNRFKKRLLELGIKKG